MFRGFFGFKSVKNETKRKQIYAISRNENLEKEKKRKYEQEQVDLKSKFNFRAELLGKKIAALKIRIDSSKSLTNAIPYLIDVLKKRKADCTIFVSSGKCGSGENIFSLLNPLFYKEIVNSRKLKAEGFDTVFSGILLPKKDIIQPQGMEILKEIKENKGFDLGTGCFSPPVWIKGVLKRDEEVISMLYNLSIEEFEKVFGTKCSSFSAPSFFCSNATMLEKENFYFDYSSDCRGTDPFFPVIDTKVLKTPQVPVTLPLISEWLCSHDKNPESFFKYILEEIEKQKYPVYEILPPYEGMLYKEEFEKFLDEASKRGIIFISLRELLGLKIAEDKPLPRCTLSYGLVEGRRQFATIQMFEV